MEESFVFNRKGDYSYRVRDQEILSPKRLSSGGDCRRSVLAAHFVRSVGRVQARRECTYNTIGITISLAV